MEERQGGAIKPTWNLLRIDQCLIALARPTTPTFTFIRGTDQSEHSQMDFQHHQHNERCLQCPEVCEVSVGLSQFTHSLLLWLEFQTEYENCLRMLNFEQEFKLS